jgi:hypothetical protein
MSLAHPGAAGDPPTAVGIAPRAVAGGVDAGEGSEIGLEEALLAAHLPGSGARDNEVVLGLAVQFLAVVVE